jgi:hypothetical protein
MDDLHSLVLQAVEVLLDNGITEEKHIRERIDKAVSAALDYIG